MSYQVKTLVTVILLAAIGAGVWFTMRQERGPKSQGGTNGQVDLNTPPLPDKPTFAEHIAPLVYNECVVCHRPGQVAPFSLITYDDVRKRGQQLVDVTASRYMPPFLPNAAVTSFRNERHLHNNEIAMLQRWVEQGCPEGDVSQAPTPPQFSSDWQLGEPDLILTMDREYTLPAEGDNVFRHFVIPIPTKVRKYCRGFEFRTTNPRIVHHARFLFDETQNSRILDDSDPEPGFSVGMGTGSGRDPDGHWLGWTPGKQAVLREEKYAWPLPPASDLVIELHMLPTGKPEPLKCEFAFYYSDTPPTDLPAIVRMGPTTIDIAPNQRDYEHTDQFKIPVDVELLNIYPHAHLIAQKMQSFATFPDGKRICLIDIPQWDFNWQDEYQYAEPLSLPAGTVVDMKYTFDNSPENVRNPFSPPQRIMQGEKTTDEMGDLWFQLVPVDRSDRRTLQAAVHRHEALWVYREAKFLCENRPSVQAYNKYGMILNSLGKPQEAKQKYEASLKLDPKCVPAINNLAAVEMKLSNNDRAAKLLEQALKLRPGFPAATKNLGLVRVRQKRFRDAITLLKRVSERSREDVNVWLGLATSYAEIGEDKAARDCAEYTLRLDPQCEPAFELLGRLRRKR